MADALAIPFETVLRNIRRAGLISFKGRGRGAAAMTTLDAARLLITAAGSHFVKDSLETIEEFGSLQPVGAGKPARGNTTGDFKLRFSLEEYLAETIQRLIDEKGQLPSAYRRPPQNHPSHGGIALTLMSAVGSPRSCQWNVSLNRTGAGERF
jgi:hypothetical protein